MLSPTTCGAPPAAIHSLCAGGTISFGLRSCPSKLASTTGRIEFTLWPHDGHGVTAWSFSSRCSPPGVVAPRQLRSDAGLPVSARSGTLTLLSKSALRRTSADVPVRSRHSKATLSASSGTPLRSPLLRARTLAVRWKYWLKRFALISRTANHRRLTGKSGSFRRRTMRKSSAQSL